VLTRSGNTFTANASPDGVSWVQVGTPRTITMTGTVYVGLAVSSGQNSTLATGTFDNVSASHPWNRFHNHRAGLHGPHRDRKAAT
jgi:hypothetical protein